MTGFAALQHDWLCRFSAIVLHTSTPIGHSTAGVQIGHLQDALHELRDSLKVSMEEASSEREQFEVQANAQAEVDKALYEVCPPLHPTPLPPSFRSPLSLAKGKRKLGLVSASPQSCLTTPGCLWVQWLLLRRLMDFSFLCNGLVCMRSALWHCACT